jgi:hypothetical protein
MEEIALNVQKVCSQHEVILKLGGCGERLTNSISLKKLTRPRSRKTVVNNVMNFLVPQHFFKNWAVISF